MTEDTTLNGFVTLGLAPELVQAVADLGYTQPTTVQSKTIPLALPSEAADAKKGFIDLMVSSQTGSGKTAAFLLPVLHTLIQQQAQAEAADKAGVVAYIGHEWRWQAERLALATVEGAAALAARSGESPEALARRVASPGGTTEAGLKALDAGDALARLVEATLRAAREAHAGPGVGEGTFQALLAELGSECLTDLVITIAFYCAVVRILGSFAVDVEPEYQPYLDKYPLPAK